MALVDRVHSHFAAGTRGPQVRTHQHASIVGKICSSRVHLRNVIKLIKADRNVIARVQSQPTPVHRSAAMSSLDIDEGHVVTRFIAETLLPTKHGKFRLRGYKHSVRGIEII